MKKTLKKVCACMLCATMLVGIKVPSTSKQDTISVSAEEDHDGEFIYQNKTYQYKNIDSSKISIVRIKEQGGEITVPSTITIGGKKKTVTRIDSPFADYQSYNAIAIPNTVTEIAENAFGFSVINKLKLSDNLEKIGDWCFWSADINQISCGSKKIKEIGGYVFWDAKSPDIVVLGDWLVRYNVPSNVKTVDLTSSKLSGVKKAVKYVFNFDEHVTDLKIGNDNCLLNQEYFWNYCHRYFENIYWNGRKIKCTSANDTVPKFFDDNFVFFDRGKFNFKYACDKASFLLKNMGLTYYGPNNKNIGKLSANTEYNICKKVHDYVVNEYVYDTPHGSYLWVLNTHTTSVCETDCQIFAFLAECAGVDTETCFWDNGNHAFDVVKVGGNSYYVDTTADRCCNSYYMFLASNASLEANNNDTSHLRYSRYGEGPWEVLTYCFVNRDLILKNPQCNITHADLDMNHWGYGEERYLGAGTYVDNDERYLLAFSCAGETIKNKCLASKDRYVKLTDKEFKTINSSIVYGKAITLAVKEKDKIKLVFDPKAADINFDGAVNVGDSVAFYQRSGKPMKDK